jgi:drug/metabolite transporter (DMT)-like permease
LKERFFTTHIVLAILACLLWSTAFVGVKFGLKFAKPLSFAGIRFMLSGLILLPFCGQLSLYFRTVISHIKIILLISFFQTFLLYGLFYTGMTLIPGALGAIVIGSSPLFSAIAAHFLTPDDEMNLVKTIIILIGIIGVVLISISRQPWSANGFSEFIGVFLLILGCISSAVGNIIVSSDKKNIDPLILNSAQIFAGGLLLFLISLPLEGFPHFNVQPAFYAALLWLSILSAVAFSIWFTLLKKPEIKVSELNLWKFIIPVFGALFSWTLLPDEAPELFSVIGMSFIAVSIFSYNLFLLKSLRESV